MKKAAIVNTILLGGVISIITACGGTTTTTAPTGGSGTGSAPTESSAGSGTALQQESSAASIDRAPSNQGAACLRRNFYFVFDGSGSMKHAPRVSGEDGHQSKISGAKWAVREFMTKVPADVNLGLYVFDRNGHRQVLPLGANNRAAFLEAIDNVQAGRDTPLGAAIAEATEALSSQYKKQLGYGEYRLIVITDGEATDSLARGVIAADESRIPIYTIGFDMGQDHALRKHSVSYRSAVSAAEVEKALEDAAAELDVFDSPAFSGKLSQRPRQH